MTPLDPAQCPYYVRSMPPKVVVEVPGKGSAALDDLLRTVARSRQELAEVEELAVIRGRRAGVSWGFMAGLLGISERGLRRRYSATH